MKFKGLIAALCLVGICTGESYSAKVAVVLSRSLPPYKATWSGLSAKSDFEITRFNMEGETVEARQIMDRIAAGSFDLLITIGSEATAASSGVNVPLVYTMVLEKPELKTHQATGLLMDIRWEDKARYLKQLFPKMAKMGVIYSQESVARVNPVRSAVSSAGIQLIPIFINSPEEFSSALASLTMDKVDLIAAVPDSVTIQQDTIRLMIDHALGQKIPLIALSEPQVSAGALGVFSIDFFENGSETFELAKKMLAGQNTQPVHYPSKVVFYVNAATKGKINLGDFHEIPGLKIIQR